MRELTGAAPANHHIEKPMKARELLNSAILEPETVVVVRTAFDRVWAAIGSRYSSERDIAQARLLLARAALALVARHPDDVETLTSALLAHAATNFSRNSES